MRYIRELVFLDTAVVSEAFLHHEIRNLDNVGCFSFGDVKYESSTALANTEVEIAFDPMNTETIKVMYRYEVEEPTGDTRIGLRNAH